MSSRGLPPKRLGDVALAQATSGLLRSCAALLAVVGATLLQDAMSTGQGAAGGWACLAAAAALLVTQRNRERARASPDESSSTRRPRPG